MSNVNPITVFCDHCKANPGTNCTTKSGNNCSTHKVRVDAAGITREINLDNLGIDVDLDYSGAEKVNKYLGRLVEPKPDTDPFVAPTFQAEIRVEPVIQVPVELQKWNPKQVFHVVSNKNLGRRVREAFSYTGDAVYDMEVAFLKHETRAYLEEHMPCEFAVISDDDLKQALVTLQDGINLIGAKSSFNGEVLTGFVKDGSGATLILTPKGIKVTFKDLGIRVMLKTTSDIGKFMKYLKRLFAMYRHSVTGDNQIFVDGHNAGPTLLYTLDSNPDQQFRIRYDSPLLQYKSKRTGKMVDFKIEGCSYVTPRWANAHLGLNPDTGRKWKVGDAGRITFTCQRFMWKGHIMVINMKNVDATFWDCKRVIGTDSIFVGFMGTLHAGKLHLGLQEIVDWGLMSYAKRIGKIAIEQFADDLNNPKHGFNKFVATLKDKLEHIDDEDGKVAQQIANWRMMNAIYQNFTYANEPFMIRDAYRSFERDVLDVQNGRVLVPESHGFRAYYFIDPWCITDDGTFDMSRARLSGNCVYSPKLVKGIQAVTFRNPHTIHEYQIIQSVGPYGDVHLVSDQVMIVSVDIAMDFAEAQGGGDFDDCGNIYYCSDVVNHFKLNLPAYPAKLHPREKIKVAEFMQRNFLVKRYGLDIIRFDKQTLIDKIRDVQNADAGVGMIDNYLRVRMCLSLYLPEILADVEAKLGLAELDADREKLTAAIHWLKSYDRYGENEIASAYEDAIDSIVMNGAKGGVQVGIGKVIRAFWESCLVVPFWATVGGHDGNGRIPSRCLDKNPVVAMDPISLCIADMREMGEDLTDFVNTKQWLGLQMAPLSVRNYPVPDEVKAAVTLGQAAWKASMRARMGCDLSKSDSHKSFIDICKKHKQGFANKSHEFVMAFMAELETRVYDGPYGAPKMFDGRPVSGPDAYVNNPEFFPLRVQLYQELGLCGKINIQELLAEKHGYSRSVQEIAPAEIQSPILDTYLQVSEYNQMQEQVFA